MSTILVAIGSNLAAPNTASPLATCRAAVLELARLPQCKLRALSRWYASAPVPPSGQPSYVNGVAALDGTADPAWLLRKLQAIERHFGRARSVPNAARTLDLDIVAMGRTVRDRPDPVLPHPRAHLRAFVLRPLADVVPGWVHPVLGQSVEELLNQVADQQLRVLADDTEQWRRR